LILIISRHIGGSLPPPGIGASRRCRQPQQRPPDLKAVAKQKCCADIGDLTRFLPLGGGIGPGIPIFSARRVILKVL
jgi:hypothetical protein